MAIVINGSGTISGISVGGLPDSIVDAGTLATNSVDSAELIDGAVDNSHMAAMAASKLTGTVATARLPAGTVLQVVSVQKTSFFSTNSLSYVDVTGVSAAITPSSTSSKILVTVTGAGSGSDTTGGYGYGVVYRGSTQIMIGDSRGSAQRASFELIQSYNVNHVHAYNFVVNGLDSPSTTSAVTYKIQIKRTDQTSNVGVGGTYDTGDGNRCNVPTTITLTEIGA